MKSDEGFFRGSEGPRFLLLLGLLIVGWPIVLYRVYTSNSTPPPPPPAPTAKNLPPLPPPDTSLVFRGIVDRQPLNPRENPAYRELLKRARTASTKDLEAQARRDVVFSQLIDAPERYRGLPIHIEGNSRRTLYQDVAGSSVFPKGRYYEMYVTTPDSQSHPVILVFEEPPADLIIGDDTGQRVAFDGYFFKLMAYRAADKWRFAPLFVGRFPTGSPVAAAPAAPVRIDWGKVPWTFLALGMLSVYLVIRLIMQFARIRKKPEPVDYFAGRARDYAEPEALTDWLNRDEPTVNPEGRDPSDGTS